MAKSPGVLIVDQDPDARYQVQQLVRQAAFDVSGQAGLGTEAVAIATEVEPDIILCGLKEPISRVVQTIESLAHSVSSAPIIVYSTSSDLETVRKVMLAGARDFLQAPFKPDDLKRSLMAALESEERRRLQEAGRAGLGPQGSIITVYGAKGGTGKTTLSANVAVAMARRTGQSTVLVDADDTFGDAAASLALSPDRTVTEGIRELASGDGNDLKEFLTHHESGLAVLSAPVNPFEWKGVSSERVQKLLHRLARQFDVVMVDTGSTLGDVSQGALEAASLVLWVTTPDYSSVRDSLHALQAIRNWQVPDDRIRVILNVASPEVEVRPNTIEEVLGRQIFWTIPYDRQLRGSTQLGQALIDAHPRSPAATNITDLALALNGAPPEPRSDGILRRLLGGVNARPLSRQRLEVEEEAPK
jgi:pilus assembly protein CpaE